MASPFGISFVPGAQPDNQNGMTGGRAGASRNPIQEAVKILSLRLPKFYGSGAIAPAPLLQAPGGMGQPTNPLMEAIQRLSGAPKIAFGQPPMAAPQIPTLGGGTDTTTGWNQQERELNRPQAPSGIQDQIAGLARAAASAIRTPRIVPGQTTDGGGDVYAPPGNWIDPRPSAPVSPSWPAPDPGMVGGNMSPDGYQHTWGNDVRRGRGPDYIAW